MSSWPAFDSVLAALAAAPSRTGSLIVTVYGDAVLPRGGALALSDLLLLMERLGAGDGVVRTAVSRLARDGLLRGRRIGRRSAYALTETGQLEFTAAIPRIYGPVHRPWDGRLRLALPEAGVDRSLLDRAGFVLLAPGILVGTEAAPDGVWLEAGGQPEMLRHVAGRAWPLHPLRELYDGFLALFTPMADVPDLDPAEAIAARVALIHAWRRIALRDPKLPAGLLPEDWPGAAARRLCAHIDQALLGPSERWLDGASDGGGALPAAEGRQRFEG